MLGLIIAKLIHETDEWKVIIMRLRKVICYVLFIAIMFMASMSTFAATLTPNAGSSITLKAYEADAEERRGRFQYYGLLGEVDSNKKLAKDEIIAVNVELEGIDKSQLVQSLIEYDTTKFELIRNGTDIGFSSNREDILDGSNIIQGAAVPYSSVEGNKERLRHTVTIGTKSSFPKEQKDLIVYLFKAKEDNTAMDFKVINGQGNQSYMLIDEATIDRSFATANDLVGITELPNQRPVVRITGPGQNVSLTEGSFSLSGIVSDQDGDDLVVKATIGGVQKTANVSAANTAKSFQLTWNKSDIANGSYSNIVVEAVDPSGAKAQHTWGMTLTVSDSKPDPVPQPNDKPVVTILGPIEDVYLQNGSFSLNGTVTDTEDNVVTVSAILDGITRSQSVNVTRGVSATYSLNWNRSELTIGRYKDIQVKAVDSKNGTSNAVWGNELWVQSETVTPVEPDNLPPVVTFTSPLTNTKLDAGMFNLEGTVVDPEDDNIIMIARVGNLQKEVVLSTTSSAWYVSFNKDELQDGYYYPEVVATDLKGNGTTKSWGYTLTVGDPPAQTSSSSSSSYVSPADLPLYKRTNGKKDGDTTTIKLTDRRVSYELRKLVRSKDEEKVLKVKVPKKDDEKGDGYKFVIPSTLWKSDKYDGVAIKFITPFGEMTIDGETLDQVKDREVIMEFDPMTLDEADRLSKNIEQPTSAVKVTLKDKSGNDLSIQKPIQVEMLSDKKIVYPEILQLVRRNTNRRLKYNLPIATDERKQKVFFEVNESGDYVATYNFRKVDDYKDMIWAYKEMNILYSKYIIREEDSTFRPQDQITRGEFTDLLVRTLRLYEGNSYLGNFVDITRENKYHNNITLAKQNGIVIGVGEEMFADGQKLKREHMALMIQRTLDKLGIEDDGSVYDLAEFSDAEHVTNDYITRAEAAVVLYRLMNLN